MRQVWSKVSSCRRSAADCSCSILVCGKSGAKFYPATDLPQTVPVAYWYAASLQQNFILPQICRRLFLWHTGMRQVCNKISFCRILRHTLCRRLKVCRRSAAGLRQVCGILFTFLWVLYWPGLSAGWINQVERNINIQIIKWLSKKILLYNIPIK